MMYQVGSLILIKPEDPAFSDYWDAVKDAIDKSEDDNLYGIWEKETGDLNAIVYGGELFAK